MLYTIKIKYTTGSSFGNHEESDELEGKFPENIAKANLVRIKQHYEYYRAQNSFRNYYSLAKPESVAKPEFWKREGSIELLTPEGGTFEMSAMWIGYFETLISVEAVPVRMIYEP